MGGAIDKLLSFVGEYLDDVDYVIASGTTDGWNWEKWKKGKACARKKSTSNNLGVTGQIGGFYYRNYQISLPPGLFDAVNVGFVSCSWGTGVSWGSVKSLGTDVIEAQYFSNQNGGAGTFYHEVTGKWKE